MKTLFRRGAILALPLLTLTPAVLEAAGYNPAIVGADARWVVHADLNSLRSSQLGKVLIGEIEKAQKEATTGVIGVNVPKLLSTVGTITAYGNNLTPKAEAIDGTLIAQGTADLVKIAESALLQGTLAEPKVFSEVTDLPFPAYAISDPKAPEGKKEQVFVAFPPEKIVIVSKSKAQITKAREVFNGSAPSIAKTTGSAFTKLATNAEGAFLFAASMVPTETFVDEKSPQARILQLTNAGSLAFGERGADTFAHVDLFASSDRNAEKLGKILEGLTSMLSLAESNDKHLAEFLNATKVTREKDMVALRLAYPTERLVLMTNMLKDQLEAKPVQRNVQITHGKTIAEWTASDVAAPESGQPNALSWKTVENVKLLNGVTVTVGRLTSGGKIPRIDRIEVMPAGGGAPMTFAQGMLRQRNWQQHAQTQFSFPGADGDYTVKVGFVNDVESKAKFALSVFDPKEAAAQKEKEQKERKSGGPMIPEPKFK